MGVVKNVALGFILGCSSSPGSPSPVGAIKLFDQVPQFGIYRVDEATPPNYTPPPGVISWKRGTYYVTKLDEAQKNAIGQYVAARITYHAQCDNYDRIGNVFLIVKPRGEMPNVDEPRTELVRFITPFSSYRQPEELATYTFPDADLSPFARTLADPTRDVWIGLGGGSNPYGEDPCATAGRDADFSAIGFKYSLEFVSSVPRTPGNTETIALVPATTAMSTPIEGRAQGAATALSGQAVVIVSGHGSEGGGNEYDYTTDTLLLNGEEIGSFSTGVDCSPYGALSPEGNQGIFQASNRRNWCPGALVDSRAFPAKLLPDLNTASLKVVRPSVPAGSYFSVSVTFVGAPE